MALQNDTSGIRTAAATFITLPKSGSRSDAFFRLRPKEELNGTGKETGNETRYGNLGVATYCLYCKIMRTPSAKAVWGKTSWREKRDEDEQEVGEKKEEEV